MWNIGTSLEEENGEAIIKKYQIFQTSRKASTAFYYKSHNSKTNVKKLLFLAMMFLTDLCSMRTEDSCTWGGRYLQLRCHPDSPISSGSAACISSKRRSGLKNAESFNILIICLKKCNVIHIIIYFNSWFKTYKVIKHFNYWSKNAMSFNPL